MSSAKPGGETEKKDREFEEGGMNAGRVLQSYGLPWTISG